MDKDYLIQKWLVEELTPEEQKAFDALEDASFLKGVVNDAKSFRASQFSKAKSYEDFKKALDACKAPTEKLNWIRPLLRIASVFILGLSLYYFFLYETPTRIETQFGEKTTIILPDHSSVSVNALSEIAYKEKGWKSDRTIKLEGEAFFDVAKGKRFVVSTPKGTVTVLGTEFNVKQRDDFFEVKCFEGSVRVHIQDHETVLGQGDNVRWYMGVVEQGKNTYSAPQWTKNISDFQRAAISQVFSELERQYGVTVTLENIDGKRLFTGGFVHDNLEDALKSITVPLDLEYVIMETDKVRVKPREQ